MIKMNKKIILYIGMMLLLSLSVFSIADSNELLEVMEEYYSTFTSKDLESYMNLQFTYHLSSEELEIKRNNIKNIFENVDILGYEIGNFEVASNDGEVAIVTYVVKSKLGQILENGPKILESEQSMTAILTTWNDEWKIFSVSTTDMFDFNMNLADASDLFPEDLLYKEEEYEEPSLVSKVGSFFKGMPKLISKPFKKVKPETCGNFVCDSGEDIKNCGEDCKRISFSPECGNGVCSEQETYENCPYDCISTLICGDNICNDIEKGVCEIDCPSVCGDGKCEFSEDETCRPDCKKCGDGICELDETEDNCFVDCEVKSVCGDGVCDKNEDCSSCSDCSCKDGSYCKDKICIAGCTSKSHCGPLQTCFDYKCVDVKCVADSDCDDGNECTINSCMYSGEPKAFCYKSKIDECDDGDGCCPSGCTIDEDDDCDEDAEDNTGDTGDTGGSTGDTTYANSGTSSIRNDNDHEFFDFDEGKVTTNFDKGDVFINQFNEMMAECSNAVCAAIKKESGSYTSMTNPPSSGYDGYAEIQNGDRYWIKTIQGNYAKMEITGLTDTKMTFKWALFD